MPNFFRAALGSKMARGGRGRGGFMMGRGGMRVPFFAKKNFPPAFVPRHPFDMALCEQAFPRVKPLSPGSEEAFTQVRSLHILGYSSHFVFASS